MVFDGFSQGIIRRTTIQDYATVLSLQAETLVSKDNDKVYIKATQTVYAWDVLNTQPDDGLDVIKQNSVAVGRFVRINKPTESNKTQPLLTGGGRVLVYSDSYFSWTERFIVLGGGRGVGTRSTSGYYDIILPPVGTAIVGHGGAANRTVAAKGILLNIWEVLYYDVPTGNNNSINTNFHIMSNNADFVVPNNWVMIAMHNGDAQNEQSYKIGNGDSIFQPQFLDATDPAISIQGYQIERFMNRQAQTLSGGGTKNWNGNAGLFSWNQRFICITGGSNSMQPSGYFDINMPTSGNALVANNTGTWATRTWTANGIVLNAWEALYYVCPIGQANTSIATNYRIVPYNFSARVPSHWLLIATRNGDYGVNDFLKLGTSEIIYSKSAWTNLILPKGVVNYNNGLSPAQYRLEYGSNGRGVLRLRGMLQINTVPAAGASLFSFQNNIPLSYTTINYVHQYSNTTNYDRTIRIDINGNGGLYQPIGTTSVMSNNMWLSLSEITIGID